MRLKCSIPTAIWGSIFGLRGLHTSRQHAIALHNRGVVRAGLHLDRLGRVDTERAKQLGFVPPKRRLLLPTFLWFVFKLTAGLVFDD